MTTPNHAGSPAARVLVRGVHLELSPALSAAAVAKAEHLLGHETHIVRVRIDLEKIQTRSAPARFAAKGRVEISGPDLLASAESDDAYKSLDLLVDKLDELLRRRHQKRVNSRNDQRRQAPDVLHGEK